MNKVKKKIQDSDLASVEVALRRAARRARTIAEKTHTPLVIYENGRVIKEIIGKEKTEELRTHV